MEEKKKNTSPILIVCLVLLCVAMLLVGWWLGNKFYDKENPTTPEEKGKVLTCGDWSFDTSKDNLEDYTIATGWSGAGAGITYKLWTDNKLMYETWIETTDEETDETNTKTSKTMDTNYTCEYLFDNDAGTGLCYSNGKFYRLDFNDGVFDKNDIYSIKSVIEDVTEICNGN